PNRAAAGADRLKPVLNQSDPRTMRITPQILLNIAQDTVKKRKRSEWDLLSAYLIGSLVNSDPLLGGSADIDLVFVHNNDPEVHREIIPVSDDVHLDILHYARADLQAGRKLRGHPYLGPEIFHCMILYDPQHFMDFVQAGVRGLYGRPDYVHERAQALLDSSRKIWRTLYMGEAQFGPPEAGAYLDAVECAANSFASLTGPPLAVRRMLAALPARAEALGKPGLYQGIIGLLGGGSAEAEDMRGWVPEWRSAVKAASRMEESPTDLLPPRGAYYRSGIEAYLESETGQEALWPLVRTWTQAAAVLPEKGKHRRLWAGALGQLGLSKEAMEGRLAALDAFLDNLEETLEEWAQAHGA
ncbi:MAG: hypothetical protein R3335_13025, partial [Anaerolineales bacterium]|nr:hypothetical protein [Anaerolineales bacterium]